MTIKEFRNQLGEEWIRHEQRGGDMTCTALINLAEAAVEDDILASVLETGLEKVVEELQNLRAATG